jgi:hypothetical protein
MSIVADWINPFDNPLTRAITGKGGGDRTPEAPQAVAPPVRADAAPAADMARRQATARGRASTILTDELGVGGVDTTNRRRLLGVGG